MDMQVFWQGVERIADEFNIGKHPLAQLVQEGKATKQQIKQFAVEHYEMTVRDSGPYIANGYVNMTKLSAEGAELIAIFRWMRPDTRSDGTSPACRAQ
jgi:hypothetical protein